MGIQALISQQTGWRDVRIAELQKKLDDPEPWRRALDHNEWRHLKSDSPETAVRAAYRQGVVDALSAFDQIFRTQTYEARREMDRAADVLKNFTIEQKPGP